MGWNDMPKNGKAVKKRKKTKRMLTLRERMYMHKWYKECGSWELLGLVITGKHQAGTRMKWWADGEVSLNNQSYDLFLQFLNVKETEVPLPSKTDE